MLFLLSSQDDEYEEDFVVSEGEEMSADDEPDWRKEIRKLTGYDPSK